MEVRRTTRAAPIVRRRWRASPWCTTATDRAGPQRLTNCGTAALHAVANAVRLQPKVSDVSGGARGQVADRPPNRTAPRALLPQRLHRHARTGVSFVSAIHRTASRPFATFAERTYLGRLARRQVSSLFRHLASHRDSAWLSTGRLFA